MSDLFLLEWLQQLDLSAFSQIGELDWTSLATYGAIMLALGSVVWTSSKNLIQFLWSRTEKLVGFLISSVVVFALWYGLLRVHVSISFNLDKEVFDNLLWISALLFTPYYLIHYGLLRGVLLTGFRGLELIVDLFVFSWFPQRAEQNRTKWLARMQGQYSSLKSGAEEFVRLGLKSIKAVRMPFGLGSSQPSEDSNT